MNIGFERKIGYSFLGLMAGNVATLALILLIAVLLRTAPLSETGPFWKLEIGEALGFSIAGWLVSMAAWVVVGLPIVLSLRAELVAEFHWATAGLIGVVIGVVAMLLFFLALDHGRLDMSMFKNPQGMAVMITLFSMAALIAGTALIVYSSLMRTAMRRQAKEEGAPLRVPRSLAWFDF